MTKVTPWWEALTLRQEVLDASGAIDDVQMSLFQAVYGTGRPARSTRTPAYYGEITHPTGQLVDLLAKVAVRLGGGDEYTRARALTRLDQGMGGGKSQACIGAWHLAAHPEELAETDVGERSSRRRTRSSARPSRRPQSPHVVVLSCDNMTPGRAVQELDGPADNLYERFLWRLFAKDYPRTSGTSRTSATSRRSSRRSHPSNRPVLIIVDEIMDYVGNGLDGTTKPELVAQDMAFLRALLDAVNDVPNVAHARRDDRVRARQDGSLGRRCRNGATSCTPPRAKRSAGDGQ